MSLYEMRRSYTLGGLDEKDIDPDPMVQFRKWLSEALENHCPEWMEVNAMTLSTSAPSTSAPSTSGTSAPSGASAPSGTSVTSRIVLLKGLDQGKFWFYTNYDSRKAEQISANPNVSLCFLWQHVQRQVRIEGVATQAPREQSVAYFKKRPRDSQIGAIVSSQSSEIPSREVLETRLAELQKKYVEGEIPCPDNWGGYGVQPTRVEFWQGRQSRLHDRLQYEREGDTWKVRRLSP